MAPGTDQPEVSVLNNTGQSPGGGFSRRSPVARGTHVSLWSRPAMPWRRADFSADEMGSQQFGVGEWRVGLLRAP
jgi:hypothetical protein